MTINYHKWGYPPCLGKKKCTWIACCSIPQISHAFVLRWNGKYKSRLLRRFCLWVLCHPHQLSDVAISVSVSKQIQLQKIFQLFIVLSKRKCFRDGDESEFLWLQFMVFSQIDKGVKMGLISNGWSKKSLHCQQFRAVFLRTEDRNLGQCRSVTATPLGDSLVRGWRIVVPGILVNTNRKSML